MFMIGFAAFSRIFRGTLTDTFDKVFLVEWILNSVVQGTSNIVSAIVQSKNENNHRVFAHHKQQYMLLTVL